MNRLTNWAPRLGGMSERDFDTGVKTLTGNLPFPFTG